MKTIDTPSDVSSFHIAENGGHESEERRTSIWKLCIEYKGAVLWSLFISIGALMWGYDILLSNALSSIPGFQQDFGDLHDGVYAISDRWQILFNTSPYIGTLVGSIVAGHFSDKVGRKNPLAIACIISTGAIAIQIFSEQSGGFLVGKLIHGLSLGCFLTISSSYAAEIVPTNLRFITTSSVQLLIGLGQLLASIAIKIFGSGTYPIAYKIPLMIQFLFPIVLLCGIKFCPESPWFLLRNGDIERCSHTLRYLGFPDPDRELWKMQATIEGETSDVGRPRDYNTGRIDYKSYLDCFKGDNLRRTETAIGALLVSQLVGAPFIIESSSYFFELAFFQTTTIQDVTLVATSSDAFSLCIGVTILGLIGIVASWFVISNTKIGRRELMLSGTLALAILLLLIGILDVIPTSSRVPFYGQSVCIIAFTFVYFLTTGTTASVILAEVPSTRLRTRTIGLAIFVQSLFGILMNIVVPIMVNPNEANLGGKIGFIFAVTSALSLIWIYFRVPETGNRSFNKLNMLFHSKVPARKFKTHQFDTAMV